MKEIKTKHESILNHMFIIYYKIILKIILYALTLNSQVFFLFQKFHQKQNN